MRRRTFLTITTGAAIAGALALSAAAEPTCTCDWKCPENVWQKWVKHKVGCPLRDGYWCECGLVFYDKRPDGEHAATHILIDGKWEKFNYGLSRHHQRVHERMWASALGMTHQEWFEWRWRGGPGPK
jgi:hypothetical protein